MKRIIIIILIFCCSGKVWSQNQAQIIGYADRLYLQKEYSGAVQFYKTALNIDSTNVRLLYKYALSLSELNQLEKASHYFNKVVMIDRSDEFPFASYELAETYYKLENYRYADRYYRRALRPYRGDKDSEWYKRITQRMASIDYVQAESSEDVESIEITQSPNLNSYDSEFSPNLMNDTTLLLSSLRADTLLNNNRIKDKDYYSRIYKSIKTGKDWSEPEQLSPHVNLIGWDVANPAYDGSNNYLYFSKCDTLANCEIWRSKFLNGSFQTAEMLGSTINLYGSNNTQPYPTNINGKDYLFFVSDRDGGYGGLDIWYAEINSNGTFNEATNAGSQINSIDNEISPYYFHRSNELYFASDWHFGYGGYDIFKSKGVPGNFSAVENLGRGINSSHDDYYFTLGKQDAFFASDRPQSKEENNICCNDIYYTPYKKYKKEIEEDIVEVEKKKVTTRVLEQNVVVPQEVNVEILNRYLPVELYFDNDSPDPNSRDTTTSKNYMNLYKNYIIKQDQYIKEYSSASKDLTKEVAAHEIVSFFDEKVETGVEKLQYFMPLLIKELEKGNKIEMTIKGYASSISKSDYNLNLTLRRIESLINYLKAYNNGELSDYINKTAPNGGVLSFIKLPFGDYVNSNDKKLSGNLRIYSPQAASNRKIEILAVTETEEGKLSIDGGEIQGQPKVKFNSISYELKIKAGEKVAPKFLLKNEGTGDLNLYAVDVNCECITLEYSKKIKAGNTGHIEANIDSKGLKGSHTFEILVISNAIPNIQRLSIKILME